MKNISKENYLNFQLEKALINESDRNFLFKLEEAILEIIENLKSKIL